MGRVMADSDDLHREALDDFHAAEEAESHNRSTGEEDIRFAREGVQWPEDIANQRSAEGRPTLTINKMPAFIRQVVNDARQNKPAIKVHPADSNADPETAEVLNGLIRNIEYTSNADVAYDTATECAVGNGFGYIRVGVDYAYDDSFDQDITINRVANPFSIYGDPNSTAADSSDWNRAFVVDRMSKDKFKAEWGKEAADNISNWTNTKAWHGASWAEGDDVMIAEWWKREEIERKIVLLSNGQTRSADDLEKDEALKVLVQAGVLQVKAERLAKSCKVTQRFMSGADILEEREWPGRFIPIIPVYGDEFDILGKRYFRSLIHNAIDAQRMFNYWRTTSTELVALAPRVPYIGPVGAFATDPNWATANSKSHPYLEYDIVGNAGPQRQPMDTGAAAGALQEALNASDDMKAIIGLYDASLGARSNETSGRAIMARQREGDVSTFHFQDNMARAIRHTGRIIVDLIPHFYNAARVVRVLGEDGKPENVQVNQQFPKKDPKTGQPIQRPAMGPNGQPMVQPNGQPMMQAVMAMHDLTTGKYDVTVTTGPSFTTRREEAAYSMTEALRAYPEGAPVIVPELAKNLDWPGADDIAEKLEAQASGKVPDQVKKIIEEGKKKIEGLTQENQQLKNDKGAEMVKAQAGAQQAREEIASKEQIAREQIASDERIAREKLMSEQRLAVLKDGGVETQDENGETVVKSKADLGTEATMQAIAGIGQLIAQQGQAMSQGLQLLAATLSAPTELVRGPDGKAIGTRRVTH